MTLSSVKHRCFPSFSSNILCLLKIAFVFIFFQLFSTYSSSHHYWIRRACSGFSPILFQSSENTSTRQLWEHYWWKSYVHDGRICKACMVRRKNNENSATFSSRWRINMKLHYKFYEMRTQRFDYTFSLFITDWQYDI